MTKFNKFEISNDKEEVLKTLFGIEINLKNKQPLDMESLNKEDTALIFIDVINGFVSEGNLSSDRSNSILEAVNTLDEKTPGFHKVFFVDSHAADSVEFKAYPPHCIKGTHETEFATLFDVKNPDSIVIEKNSVNGFHAPAFLKWLETNFQIKNFIVVGLVTDICVMNFALTLKAYQNQWDIDAEIMVPISCVETFENGETNHHGALMNLFALYNMQMNGIKLFK